MAFLGAIARDCESLRNPSAYRCPDAVWRASGRRRTASAATGHALPRFSGCSDPDPRIAGAWSAHIAECRWRCGVLTCGRVGVPGWRRVRWSPGWLGVWGRMVRSRWVAGVAGTVPGPVVAVLGAVAGGFARRGGP